MTLIIYYKYLALNASQDVFLGRPSEGAIFPC